MNWKSETPIWCNASHRNPHLLGVDQACFALTNLAVSGNSVEVYAQSSECENCTLWNVAAVQQSQSTNLIVNATYMTKLLFKKNSVTLCEFQHKFDEFGLYAMNITSSGCSQVNTEVEPANIYLPILWTALGAVGGLLLWGLLCICQEQEVMRKASQLLRRVNSSGEALENLLVSDSVGTVQNTTLQSTQRIRALDSFRGLSISLMILVNYGGGKYWFLAHSTWNGLTVADVIFPWFVWILGSSAILSLHSQLRHAIPKRSIFWKILRRSVLLFTIGLVLNSSGNNNVQTLRIPGVLQRLAFVYFIVAIIELYCHDPEDNQRYSWFAPVRDILCAWRQWIIMIFLVSTHLLLTFLLPVPGCPSGYLGPGGLHHGGAYSKCTGGAAGYIDKLVFGAQHMHKNPTAKLIYSTTEPYDPEGLLGTLTCIFSAYLGVHAGKILLLYGTNRQRIIRWFLWSAVTGLLGGGLCLFSQNGGPIPINKNLWSVSFVLVTSSVAFGTLALFYYLIDVLHLWSGAPLRYAGMNALLLYVGHVLARPLLPFSWSPVNATHGAHLTMNLCATIIWNAVAWILYKNRIFLSL